MARRIAAELVGFREGVRRFRSTEVTLTDVELALPSGDRERLPTLKTELNVVRALRLPARGTLYLSDVSRAEPTLFGLRLQGHEPVFESGAGWDAQLANLFLLILGIAFFWTGIGAYVAWTMWRQRRVFADARAARRLFDADLTRDSV